MTSGVIPLMVSENSRILREATRPVQGGTGERTATAQEVLSACRIQAEMIAAIREWVDEMVDEGIETRELNAVLRQSLGAIDQALAAFEELRKSAPAEIVADEGETQVLPELKKIVAEAGKVRAYLEPLLRLIEQPPPAVDPTTLPPDRGSPSTEGYVDLSEVLRQLQSE